MKKKILLFLTSFSIIFIGITLANIIGCVFYGLSDGNVLERVVELPYVLYAVFSLIISIIFLFLVFRKSKK